MSDVIDSGVVPLDSSSPQQHKDPISVPVERSTAKGSLSGSHSVWRRRIRATLPLLLVKKFDRKHSAGKVDIEHIEEEDSEFEEVCTPVTQATPMDTSEVQPAVSCRPLLEEQQHVSLAAVPRYRIHTSPQSPIPTPTPPSPPSAPSPPSPLEPPSDCSVISLDESPKKKLTLTQKERQKLLDWDVVTPGTFSLMAPATDRTVQKDVKPEAQPQPPPSPQAKNITEPESSPAPAEEPSTYMSGLQFWANTFRRVGTDTAILRGSRKPKPRPLSDGSISLSTLFGRTQTQTQTQGSPGSSEPPHQPRPGAVGEGAQSPQTRGSSELTTMLQQVALSRKDSANAKDDLASLPPKKLNFFSSLRVKRREGADSQEKDIWNILSKFRSKASTQTAQRLEGSSSSSDDEGEGHRDPVCDPTRQKGSSAERQRRKQEKVLIQQAKREQLKRLHRAQAIQRQLEEVEEQQRALEEKGVVLEKLLRGEMEDDPEEESQLLQTWFRLVVEKNKLARYEAELVIFAQELELEDRQSQLQQDLRRRMAISDRRKIPSERREEQRLLAEVMRVVDERDRLVSLLEEQRLMERAEDHDLETMVLSKGYQLHWT